MECLHNLIKVCKLRQVFHRVPHRVVHGEPAAHAQHQVRPVAGHHRSQDGVCLHQLDVDLDTGLNGERVIHDALQHRALVTAGGNPDIQHVVVIRVILVAQRVVIHKEGACAAADLVQGAGQEVLAHRRHLGIFAGYHDQVHVQFAFGHVLHGGTQ